MKPTTAILITVALTLAGCQGCSKAAPMSTLGPAPSTRWPTCLARTQWMCGRATQGQRRNLRHLGSGHRFVEDRSKYQAVLILGGANPHFYAAQPGHAPLRTVPVVLRADGRFVAPRVPLDEGATTLMVIPSTRGVRAARPTPSSSSPSRAGTPRRLPPPSWPLRPAAPPRSRRRLVRSPPPTPRPRPLAVELRWRWEPGRDVDRSRGRDARLRLGGAIWRLCARTFDAPSLGLCD